MKTLTLDRTGGSTAYGCCGTVRLELWHAEREPKEDPISITMTPGQAMSLIQSLSGAAKTAIKSVIE